MSNTYGYGQQFPEDTATDFNSIAFIIKRALARIRTATPVIVVSCSNSGGVSPIGTVVVQPLVNMLDAQGNQQSHGNINNVPYFRLMGGASGAIICDPVKGDIGLLVVADRDISAVQSNAAAANPGSYRRFDLADGFYVGGFLGKGTPNCYIQFDGQGNINIQDNNGNKVQLNNQGINLTPGSGNVTINGNLQLSGSIVGVGGGTYAGNLQTSGNMIAGFGGGDQVGLQTHRHGGVQTGGGTTAVPTAGT